MWSPQRILFFVFFIVCGVSCELSCTVSYKNQNYTDSDFKFATILHAKDTGLVGEVIDVFESFYVSSIVYHDDTSYINVEQKDNKITVSYGTNFPDYEEKEVDDTLLRNIILTCSPNSLTLRIKVIIEDTNNKLPKFNNETYEYQLPMPWPPGIDIPSNFGKMWVYDSDLSSKLTFSTEGDNAKLFSVTQDRIIDQNLPGESFKKPFYNVKFKAIKTLDVKDPITFTLIADDGAHKSPATVKIKRNTDESLPTSPNFALPLYSVNLEMVEKGYILQPAEGPITLENSDDVSSVTFFNGDEDFNKNFDLTYTKNEVNITIKNEFEFPESRFGLLILKVVVNEAPRHGYTVVHIAFPQIVCPTTTTSTTTPSPTTTSTTELTTTTTTTTEEPTTTTTERVTCPTCPPCPTSPPSTACPEVTCPTTVCPEVTYPTTMCPEVTCPTTACPEVTCPTTTCPEETYPTTTCPEVTCPTTTCPEVTCPTTACPEVTCPTTTWPEVTCPTTACPEITCPTTEYPEVTCPTTVCPEVTCPTTVCPEVTCPTTTCPEETYPTTTCPEVTCPTTTCPEVTCPTITTEVTETSECDCTTDSTAKMTTENGSESSYPTQESTVLPETPCPPCDLCSTQYSDVSSTTTSIRTTTGIRDSSTSKQTDPNCCECSSTTTEIGSTTTESSNTATTTTLPPGHLHFRESQYKATARVGDIGFITRIVAEYSFPIDPNFIEYGIEENSDDFVKRSLKIIDGDLMSSDPMEPGYHNFTATANIIGHKEQATVPVFLNIYTVDICDNGTGIEVIFRNSFMNIYVNEEEIYPKLTPSVYLPNVTCIFSKVDEKPFLNKFKVNPDGSINMDKIDREESVFEGVSTPEILVTQEVKCLKSRYVSLYPEYIDQDDNWSTNSMVILVHVNDINDNKPQFTQSEMYLGYPVKDIAQLELPTYLGVALARDSDNGENATIKYYVEGTDEVIIDERSGIFYPHPERFQYKDFNFTITASDLEQANSQSVELKILESKYLSEIRMDGKHLDNVDEILTDLSKRTHLLVGLVSARMITTGKTPSKPPNPSPNKDIFHSLSYLFSEDIQDKSEDDNDETEMKDDTFCLRLIVYAFLGRDPVEAISFQEAVNKTAANVTIREYRSKLAEVSSESDGLSAAVISLGVILGLIVFGAIAFVFYRCRRRMTKENDSIEAGLVEESSDMENQNYHQAHDSDMPSTSSGNMENGETRQESGDANPDRRKSVAFAEEPQVLPSEEDEVEN